MRVLALTTDIHFDEAHSNPFLVLKREKVQIGLKKFALFSQISLKVDNSRMYG
jgi:hypothetical protein